MSLDFEPSEDSINNDIISLEYHSNTMELAENLIFPHELYDLGLEEYEPNELVLKTIPDLRLFFEDESNCSCRKKKNRICFKKIGFKNFLERKLQLVGLDKNELDLCIKTQLMVFKSNDKNDETKSVYNYQYNSSIPICKPVFLKLCNFSTFKLSALQDH